MKDGIFNFKASSLEEVNREAEKHFGTTSDNIDIKIISGGKKLFGLAVSPYVVQAKLKLNNESNNEPKKDDFDGTFHFEYRELGVFLVIEFPRGDGKRISPDEIVEEATQKKIKEFDKQKISEAFYNKLEDSMIAPFQEEEKIDETVKITLSDDKMEAYIELFPPFGGGKRLSYEEVLALIENSGVVFGIDEKVINYISRYKQYRNSVKFASGRSPENGIDGELKYKIGLFMSQNPKFLDDGTVDYYERDNFNSVKAGEVIAVYKKPTTGRNGMNVCGNELTAQDGKNLPLPIGQNVCLSEDGCSIISKIDGVIEFKKEKISVSGVLTINGDVDLSVGNIKCTGNVRIMGNVTAGLSVTAEGSVEIMGTVEDASITASGDIKIRRGILGTGKGVLKSKGNVISRFIENSNVFARKKIMANCIINSYIECFDCIQVNGEKGIILGGKLKATNKIIAKNIGSNANSATILEVGIDPSLRNDYNRLLTEIKELSHKLDYNAKIIDLPDNNLSARQKVIKQKLIQDQIEKHNLLDSYKEQVEELEAILESEYDSCVSVSETIYPGTTITIKTKTCIINTQLSYSSFKIRDGEIVILSFEDKKSENSNDKSNQNDKNTDKDKTNN